MPKHHGFTCAPEAASQPRPDGARSGAQRRRGGLRLRHFGKLRPFGHGAQGQARHRGAQPRPQLGRVGVLGRAPTRAPRPGEHLRFFAGGRRQTVEAALAIARHTAEDDCAGLPDAELLARAAARPRSLPPVGAADARRRSSSPGAARRRPLRFEENPQLRGRDGLGPAFAVRAANSLGFLGGFPASRHWLSCSVIAEDKGLMQRDDWYSASRVARASSPTPATLGRYAGERALARLGARKIATTPGAGAVRSPGGAPADRPFRRPRSTAETCIARPRSSSTAWAGRCSRRSCNIDEQPQLPRDLASTPFDDEGVATRDAYHRARGRGPGLLPGQLLGAQARHEKHRQRRRPPQSLRALRRAPISPACSSACTAACSSPS